MWLSRLKVAALVALVSAGLWAVLATPATVEAESSSAAMGLVPRKDYTIKPGETVNDTIRIENKDDTAPLELTLRVVDFTYADDSGTAKLMIDPNEPQTTWSLRPYMTVPETVVVDPGASKSVDISVKIPENRGAGTLYSAILYQTGKPGDLIGLNASIATLVFTNIPGDVDEQLTLTKLGAYSEATANSPASYRYITTKKPSMIGFTLKNDGNVTEAPVGSITLKGLFGHERIIGDINPNKLLALIDQTRTFTTCIEPSSQEVEFDGANTETIKCGDSGLWPGYYKVSLEAYYGQNGNTTQEVIGSSWFLYLPLWFLAILLVVLIGIVVLVIKVKQRFGGGTIGRKKRRR